MDMNDKDLFEDSLLDKAVLRQELRRLPIEDKIKIIALMQRRSNLIRRATGRPPKQEWSWSAVGLTRNSPPPRAGSILSRLGVFEYAREERDAEEQVSELNDAIAEAHPGVAAALEMAESLDGMTPVGDYLAQFEIDPLKYVERFGVSENSLENSSHTSDTGGDEME